MDVLRLLQKKENFSLLLKIQMTEICNLCRFYLADF